MNARRGMALPAAIAAMIILAGVASLANLSATAAIRESRALRDAAIERAQRETMRTRALLQVERTARGDLVGANIAVGQGDTTLTVVALAWPWHTINVSAGGVRIFSEFARATIPNVVWCNAVVYAAYADIAGTLNIAPPFTCPDRLQVSAQFAVAFDSSVAADLVAPGDADSLIISGAFSGVARATRSIIVANGGTATGLVLAPVVRVRGGGSVTGLVLARDSVIVESGAAVTADFNAVFAALAYRARLSSLGRRGLVYLP